MTHFHVSDMKTFSDCRLRWSFSSHMRMGLSPSAPARALAIGTFMHKALERYYDQPWKTSLQCVNEAQAALEDEGPEDSYQIMENYLLWAEEHDDYEVLVVEQDFAIPLFDDHQFAGRWDLVVLRDDKIWINDFKITGMPFESYGEYITDHDEQARAYSWAAREIYGDDFGGIMFTMVRNRAPEMPLVLLNGELSRNKSQKTSWEFYKRAIHESGLKEYEYDDMKWHFGKKPFINRIAITLGDRPLDAFAERAKATAKMMLDPDVLIYPNAGPISCRMCAYSFPCSVYHSVNEKTAQKILFSDYVTSNYVKEARNVDKQDQIGPDKE